MSEDDSHNLVKHTLPLPVGHGWTCKPGNNLFVAERGAAAFEIPVNWIVRHDGKQTVSLHDLPPPKDSCRISLTIFHLPPVQGGWGALPLDKLLGEVSEISRDRHNKRKKSPPARPAPIHTEPRADLELAWTDQGCKPDPENGRPIHTRQILARARLVQVLITFDVYEDVQGKFEPAWKDLLRTLRVAVPRDLMGGVGN